MRVANKGCGQVREGVFEWDDSKSENSNMYRVQRLVHSITERRLPWLQPSHQCGNPQGTIHVSLTGQLEGTVIIEVSKLNRDMIRKRKGKKRYIFKVVLAHGEI